jgi:hypothetical protein
MITSFDFASKLLELTLGTTIQNVPANISNLQGAQRTIVQISGNNCLSKIHVLLFNLFGGIQILVDFVGRLNVIFESPKCKITSEARLYIHL